MAILTTTCRSPIGVLGITVHDDGRLLRIDLPGHHEPLPAARRTTAHADHVIEQLAQYFAGERREFSLELDLHGTPFQLAAWRALQAIPFGTTASYQQQAARIGRPNAMRAVGGANGKNPIPIVVPCHRVIGKDGALVGFGGGLSCKQWLLGHEAAVLGRREAAGARR
jgi:methylated-DNA-[protein]-cysteine S-methyltransferase